MLPALPKIPRRKSDDITTSAPLWLSVYLSVLFPTLLIIIVACFFLIFLNEVLFPNNAHFVACKFNSASAARNISQLVGCVCVAMAESPERRAAVSEVAVRLWPCARPLECGLVLPHDKHDRNKLSSQVSAPVPPR